MANRKPLDPYTLRWVARLHLELVESAEARRADHAANGNYFAVSEAEGAANALRDIAQRLTEQARALKPAKRTKR